MELSVIIPFLNEEESLPELLAWIARVMESHDYSYEVILIDDGSTDNSWDTVCELQASSLC
ncbi:MAG TPA: glycosyltransferase, partial [Chitinophagaceae bacterium]|nr:glycosyltransferase [Chitinophagaceae bacterium]